jgi:predicted HTH transcriptional regulator
MDVEDLLRQSEGKTLEFKRDLSSPSGAIKSIVAFANTSGGTIVIGIDDRSRNVVGVPSPLDEEERLANLINDRIQPQILPDIEVVPWRNSNVLIARIPASPLRPHWVKSLGVDAGVFIRVGSTSRRADPEMIAELRRYVSNQSFDEEPLPELNSEAIDFRAASESFTGVRKLRKSDLSTLRLVTDYHGKKVPTVGGILLFGVDRLSRFSDAWIRVGLFAGSDRTKILDDKEIRSTLPQATEEALLQIERMTASSIEIEGARSVARPAFPPAATREAIVNAVVHADYSQRGRPITVSLFSNRIEIENPGLLQFGLTVEDIRGGASKLRNRVIGRVFKELRLIEQWGSGIQRMTSACQDSGLAPPILEERGTSFRVTITAERVATRRLDEMDASIVEVLRRSPEGMSTSEIASAVGRSDRATRTRLLKLAGSGILVRFGSGLHDPKARWLVAQEH